ncbi:hypothetical protein ACHAWT_010627 [Skeletonema menzelii]
MVGQYDMTLRLLHCRRRSLCLLLLVTTACNIFCISAFHSKQALVPIHHLNRHETTTSIQLALQDTILEDSLQTKLDDGKSDNDYDLSSSTNDTKQRIPFIIQRLGRGTKKEIEEITQLCVDVFFNEQKDVPNNIDKNRAVAPWKAIQLAYLRNYQRGDILSRNAFKKDQLVDLIVARRVYSVDASSTMNEKVISDNCDQIFNADYLPTGGEESKLVAGEIIGYCEMMEKKFGLGGKFEGKQPNYDDKDNNDQQEKEEEEKLRPYLGNLSVVKYARRSGVGSKLMDEGEQIVREWDAGHTEIVLQVEEDNPSAIQFYKRRGWEFVFADPTCRRYDTSGFFLKESRITKYAMIKRLDQQKTNPNESSDSGESLIDKLRNAFFVSK